MRAFAYLSQGQAGWIEKEIPKPTGVDGGHPSPCWWPLHLGRPQRGHQLPGPHRILGHEGLGRSSPWGEGVKDFQVGGDRSGPPVTPDWRTVPPQLGAHQHCGGLITGQKLSNSEDGLMAEYALIRDLDANAARIPQGLLGGGGDGRRHAQHRPLQGPAGRRPAWGHGGGHGGGPVGLMAIAGARLRGLGGSWPSAAEGGG